MSMLLYKWPDGDPYAKSKLETRKETMARSVLCVIGSIDTQWSVLCVIGSIDTHWSVLCVIGSIDTHYKSIHTCVNSPARGVLASGVRILAL